MGDYYFDHSAPDVEMLNSLEKIAAAAHCPFIAGVIDAIIPDLPILEMAMLFAIFIVFANLQESQIYSDALTGLNNRRLADERLLNKLTSVSELRPLYFFIADINSFKHINDTYGHLEGDRALKIIAETFQEIGRTYHSFIARWGGDEFIGVFFSTISDPVAKIRALSADIAETETGKRLHLTLSVGIAPLEDGLSLNKEVEKADIALYTSKKNGRNQATMYHESQTGAEPEYSKELIENSPKDV